MWLAGPDLTIRGMISPINLATLKVVEEERAVMGGCVGGERRVHMSSDSDRKNEQKKWPTVNFTYVRTTVLPVQSTSKEKRGGAEHSKVKEGDGSTKVILIPELL